MVANKLDKVVRFQQGFLDFDVVQTVVLGQRSFDELGNVQYPLDREGSFFPCHKNLPHYGRLHTRPRPHDVELTQLPPVGGQRARLLDRVALQQPVQEILHTRRGAFL